MRRKDLNEEKESAHQRVKVHWPSILYLVEKGYKKIESQSLVGNDAASVEMHDLEGGPKPNLTAPPGWMSIIDDINYDVSRIKQKSEYFADDQLF